MLLEPEKGSGIVDEDVRVEDVVLNLGALAATQARLGGGISQGGGGLDHVLLDCE
jgi:hypothetical protein